MQIIKASLTPFTLPFVNPVHTAQGTVHGRKGILLEIVDAKNVKGYGEATPMHGFHMESLEESWQAMNRFLPILLREEINSIQESLQQFQSNYPLATAALSAIDTALCDLSARQQKCSVATLLTREFKTDVAASIRVNTLLHAQNIKEIIAEARDKYRQGFQTFKIKVGVQSFEEDIARCKAVRETLGNGVKIRLDANEAWTYDEAEKAFSAMTSLGVEYIEQPLVTADLHGSMRLKKEQDIAVAADEAACSAADIETILKHQVADLIILKPAATGGPHLSMSMAKLAAQVGIPSVVTTLMDGAVGRAMATHVAAALPATKASYACGLATGGLLEQDLSEGLKIHNGHISVQGVKGLGVTIDPHQVAEVASAETIEFLS